MRLCEGERKAERERERERESNTADQTDTQTSLSPALFLVTRKSAEESERDGHTGRSLQRYKERQDIDTEKTVVIRGSEREKALVCTPIYRRRRRRRRREGCEKQRQRMQESGVLRSCIRCTLCNTLQHTATHCNKIVGARQSFFVVYLYHSEAGRKPDKERGTQNVKDKECTDRHRNRLTHTDRRRNKQIDIDKHR